MIVQRLKMLLPSWSQILLPLSEQQQNRECTSISALAIVRLVGTGMGFCLPWYVRL